MSKIAAASLLLFTGTSPADPGQDAMSDSCAGNSSCCTCASPPGQADAIYDFNTRTHTVRCTACYTYEEHVVLQGLCAASFRQVY